MFGWSRAVIIEKLSILLCCSFPGPLARGAGFCQGSLYMCVKDPWQFQVVDFSSILPRMSLHRSQDPQLIFFSLSFRINVCPLCKVQGVQPYAAGGMERSASTPSCLEPEPPTLPPAVHDKNFQQTTYKIKLPPPDKKPPTNPTAAITLNGVRLNAPCLQLGTRQGHLLSPLPVSEGSTNAKQQCKEMKDIQRGKEEVKLSLLIDDV